jgi:hypothetical protein
MEFIIHRVNKISQLKKIKKIYGTEIDIRAKGSKLILSHDPGQNGDYLKDYLKKYQHGTLILNIKESGIENNVLKLVKKNKHIKNYFLLDVEIPYMFKCIEKKEKEVAVRYSVYENIEFAKQFAGKFNWLWIDTYKELPEIRKDRKIINHFKTCLVCPERWGQEEKISKYWKIIKKSKIKIDYVMTSIKTSKKWERIIKSD